MTPDVFSINGNKLFVRWRDKEVLLSGNCLRANCRCAGCRYLAVTHNAIANNKGRYENIELLAVTPMGYGLQLHFSDGHNRGIYPWRYLFSINADQVFCAESQE